VYLFLQRCKKFSNVWLRALMQSDCLNGYSPLFFEHYNRILLCDWVPGCCSVSLRACAGHNAFVLHQSLARVGLYFLNMLFSYPTLNVILYHGRPQKFFQGGQSRHFAYLFLVVDDATQIDVYKKENVQYVHCYGNSCIQCFPCKKTLYWANVCFSEHGYFMTELAEFYMNYKLCEFLE